MAALAAARVADVYRHFGFPSPGTDWRIGGGRGVIHSDRGLFSGTPGARRPERGPSV
jgi:hypothetical protein